MKYPIRCVIVDIAGTVISPEYPDIVARTPEVSKQYIGKRGLAEEAGKWGVRFTLDNGDIIQGHECWWMPEEEYDNMRNLK